MFFYTRLPTGTMGVVRGGGLSFTRFLMLRESAKMMFVFDMDGTLTPPRAPMTEFFAKFFCNWQKSHSSFLVTGSDERKIEEQLPKEIVDGFTGIFSSMGNVFRAEGKEIYRNAFQPSEELLQVLEDFRKKSMYPGGFFPNYIEIRPGMLNFSVLGRNCPFSEREIYSSWDKVHGERKFIQKELQTRFTGLDIALGGAISIDITPHGYGKGQVANRLRSFYPNDKIMFFGDRTFLGGNDYELAVELVKFPNTEVVQVSGPEEVATILSKLESVRLESRKL